MVRIFNTYGPRMHPNDGRVVSNFIVQALRGEDITLYGDGMQTRAFCYVDDLIEGFIRLMATGPEVTGPINIGNPHEIPVRELAERVIALTGARSKIVHRPLPQDDPLQRCPDISMARSVLGWEPKVDLETGLTRATAYFRQLLANFGQVRIADFVDHQRAHRCPPRPGARPWLPVGQRHIPAYNAGQRVSRTIATVLNQTLPVLEVIVVDDGSTDDTVEVVSRFGAPVRVVSKPNGGPASARNLGASLAKGHWLAMLDADDWWFPRKIELQFADAAEDDVGLSHCRLDHRVERPPRELSFQALWDRNWISGSRC